MHVHGVSACPRESPGGWHGWRLPGPPRSKGTWQWGMLGRFAGGGLSGQCFDGRHPTDKTQRISGPPGDAYIRRQHRRQSQRRIRGQELALSLPQPPTGGTYGIQPVDGSLTTPSGCRHAHARVGRWCWVWCKGARYKPGNGRRRHTKAGRPTGQSRGRTGFTPARPVWIGEEKLQGKRVLTDCSGPMCSCIRRTAQP
jgi:hypothetical protein